MHFIVHGILIHAIAFRTLRDDSRQTASRYGPRRPELEGCRWEEPLGKDTETVIVRNYEHKIDWKRSTRSSRGRSGQTVVVIVVAAAAAVVVVVVVVVVEARWTCCRMRSRHYVSQGECRQSAEALTGWSGRG